VCHCCVSSGERRNARRGQAPLKERRNARCAEHAAVTILAACLALTLPACGSDRSVAEVNVTREPWSFEQSEGTRLTTEHFDLFTTIRDAQLRDYLPGFLEATYRQYTRLLPSPGGQQSRLQTYLFADQRQWDRFARTRFPERYHVYSRIQVGGFAEGGTCVVYNLNPRSYTLSVMAHEGMHQYFGSRFDQRLPAWLNEGLACYCEGFDVRDGRPVFTPLQNTVRLNSLREALSGDALLPLNELLATDAGQVIVQSRSRHTTAYYAQAWGLVVFLQHGAKGAYAAGFRAMLDDVAAGRLSAKARAARVAAGAAETMSFGEAVFQACVTDDLDGFEKRFREYLVELAGFD